MLPTGRRPGGGGGGGGVLLAGSIAQKSFPAERALLAGLLTLQHRTSLASTSLFHRQRLASLCVFLPEIYVSKPGFLEKCPPSARHQFGRARRGWEQAK